MSQGRWILVVEPNGSDRKLIELAAQGAIPDLDVVFVDDYDDFIVAMSQKGDLPAVAILDWFAGSGPSSCLDMMMRLGFLSRIPTAATARENPMQALDESFELGVTRFISKRPDDFCFKKKVGEFIAEHLCKPKPASQPLVA